MKLKPVEHKKKEKVNPRKERQKYLDNLEKDLQDEEIELFDIETNLNIDDDYLVLPKHVTEITSMELGEYLNAFTQQKMYVRTVLSRAELAKEKAHREYQEVSDPLYKSYSKDKLSETAKERLVNGHEDVMEKADTYNDYKSKCAMLETVIDNLDSALFLFSREVSRRSADFKDETREYNVSQKRKDRR